MSEMSHYEAEQIVDLIVDELHEMGVIPERNYGMFNENQKDLLADKLVERSKE